MKKRKTAEIFQQKIKYQMSLSDRISVFEMIYCIRTRIKCGAEILHPIFKILSIFINQNRKNNIIRPCLSLTKRHRIHRKIEVNRNFQKIISGEMYLTTKILRQSHSQKMWMKAKKSAQFEIRAVIILSIRHSISSKA